MVVTMSFSAAVGIALSLACFSPTAHGTRNAGPRIQTDPGRCELTAFALRESARTAARATLWRDLARSFQEPWHRRAALLAVAMQDYRVRLRDADRIHGARMLACLELGSGAYAPSLRPNEFSGTVDALYFPLVPGRTYVYEGRKPEGDVRIEMQVLNDVRLVDGVPCRPVRTIETLNGTVVEETHEWFTRHVGSGDVWYMSELSMHYEDGRLESLHGTWTSGRDGAKPGIRMMANGLAGESRRMEYLVDEAEDIIKVIATGVTVTTAMGTYTGCVQVEEWSPLENERETKYFAPGIGLVLEVNQATGERVEFIGMR